ncbi:MAG TPA: SRPBCC family protein [Kofleriaceae bacterium]|nr:SRPBCC family protein [Kofleriaceae bacterium]
MSKSPASFSRGLLFGAALMYFCDPTRGRARRTRVRVLFDHARAKERRFLSRAARDAQRRLRGAIERRRHTPKVDVSDEVLDARIRSVLGHAPSHVGDVHLQVRGREVWLRGIVLMREANAIVKLVKHVPGVRAVHDQLERHASADIPALQRALPHKAGMWPPSLQLGAIASGAIMATWGLLARRGVTGALLATAGSALALRGGFNIRLRELASYAAGRRAVEVMKTVTVRAPIDRVFGMWRHFENFPRFMQHVQDVVIDERDPKRSRWKVDGPAGRSIEFESMITRIQHLRELAWRTLPDQRIEHTGIVRFEPVLDGTRVTIRMAYRPPGGVIGHAIAHILGWDPKARMDDDMLRMKSILEQGRTRAHGDRVSMKDLLH